MSGLSEEMSIPTEFRISCAHSITDTRVFLSGFWVYNKTVNDENAPPLKENISKSLVWESERCKKRRKKKINFIKLKVDEYINKKHFL